MPQNIQFCSLNFRRLSGWEGGPCPRLKVEYHSTFKFVLSTSADSQVGKADPVPASRLNATQHSSLFSQLQQTLRLGRRTLSPPHFQILPHLHLSSLHFCLLSDCASR